MQAELFCLCRNAETHDDGSMDIIGIFDRIQPKSRAAIVRELKLAVRVRFDIGDELKHEFQVVLFNPQNDQLGSTPKQVVEIETSLWPCYVGAVFVIHDLHFSEPGAYRLALRVNGSILSVRYLYVDLPEV